MADSRLGGPDEWALVTQTMVRAQQSPGVCEEGGASAARQ